MRRRLRGLPAAVLSSPTAPLALLLVAAFVVIGVIGPGVWGDAAVKVRPDLAYQGPSARALLGTDSLGRDVLARTLAATRLSLLLAIAATCVATVIGVPAGVLAGLAGPRVRRWTARGVGLALAVPGILVALFLIAVTGPGNLGMVLGVGIGISPLFARAAQTLATSIAELDYMAAAKVIGVSRRRLLTRYVLLNTAEPLILQIGVGANLSLVAVAALSYLGVGVQAPDYDWGAVLHSGLEALYTSPLAAITPGAAITLAGVMFSLLGEAIARSLNPALRIAAGRKERTPRGTPANDDAPTAEKSVEAAMDNAPAVARIRGLQVEFGHGRSTVAAVRGVDLDIRAGEVLGVVGESGSGKSVTALALAGLLPPSARMRAATLEFQGVDLATAGRRARRAALANRLSVVFQDPMSSLNPLIRIGRQLTERVRVHDGLDRASALGRAEERLTTVGLSAPKRRLRQYPHELSGGMRQRAMIAMALMSDPALIIADEPTTALDVTIQRQILDVLLEVNDRSGTAVLFISHDLAVVGEICDRIVVMYLGRIVEVLDRAMLDSPSHPYTRALLGAVIDLDTDPASPLTTISGQAGPSDSASAGCPFAPRCPEAMERCRTEMPGLEPEAGVGHMVACWARTTAPIAERVG
ncbi:dipeptide/oligopeptide/nickel ABC transporter permease/ATP-binding protein [Actinomadura montaniterrae]|uniref:Dipeptide/oligopeptide/nickel ABC transporter permease/ATP-binding protein n=1 Tax=Actinomadura montaniterrae TaxID=1803903 RepID=A0A6L3VZF4_9ACTN|nr:dipeptide/oligopeptide/nickel ABC transporter permease/ATP-binding protein [Actinomadura montaniterrae]KAB2384838.1 dipeptide/oligopeptide/nickel ABC transporter permease/ATP-binding protein [Actinomadura montaniterrae]